MYVLIVFLPHLQHLTKCLFFQSVNRHTAKNDEDYKNLQDVMKELEELQEYVNVSLTQSDNMGQIIAVERKVLNREVCSSPVMRAFFFSLTRVSL